MSDAPDARPAAPTPWQKLPKQVRDRLVSGLWFLTWIGLLAGLLDRFYYEAVVAFSALHAVLLLSLNRFRLRSFPVQVRLLYLLWVALGTYVPHATMLLYVAMVGLVGRLFFGYCPMARMVYLLPWNRDEALSSGLVVRVVLTPPVDGPFRPLPPPA